MKYIKIKEPYENNILIKKVHHEEKDCYVCEYNYSDIWIRASKDWVIAVADTIEELCDEFVIEFEGYVPFTSDIFYIDEEHRKEELKPLAEHYKGCKNIYGAIWTSKGLIYVAKMNEKGCLVLI